MDPDKTAAGEEGAESVPLVTFSQAEGVMAATALEPEARGRAASVRFGRSISTESASKARMVKNQNRVSRASTTSDPNKVKSWRGCLPELFDCR